MARALATPNPENASLDDLRAAMRAGNRETYRRCVVIVMLLTGSSRDQVARAFDLCDSALRKIVRAFNLYGVDGLAAKRRAGRPRAVGAAQENRIVEEFEDPGKAQRAFWTASAFHGHLVEKHGIECSYPTLVRLLHEKGFKLKVPQPWPDRQDEQLREAFRARLAEIERDPDVDIWYADETGVEGEPKPRRRWAMKGSRPRDVRNGDHVRLSILGTVCPRTGEFFAIEASHCDTDVFQAFLDEAARAISPSRKRNILVLDNASWHKRKSLDWRCFEPIHLPPYSPDFNPIERLWLVMKAEWFNHVHCKDLDALMKRADDALLDLIGDPHKVARVATPIATDF